MDGQTNQRLDTPTLLAIGVTLLTWSSAYAGIALALPAFAPAQIAFARLLIGALCFVAAMIITRTRWPAPRDWPRLAMLGVLGLTVYHLCLCVAETRIASGTAAILISLTPAATTLLSSLWLREAVGLRKLLGLSVALLGVVLVVLAGGKQVRLEPMALLVLICVAVSAIFFVGQKPMFLRSSPLAVATVTFIAGALGAAPFGMPGLMATIAAAPWPPIGALLWLGIAPSFIGYVTWNMALHRAPASQVTSFIYLSPPIAVLIGWFSLHERPSALILLGGALTIIGVMLTNMGRRATATVATPVVAAAGDQSDVGC